MNERHTDNQHSKPDHGFDAHAVRGHADDAARLLKAIGQPQRLQVLCLLIDGELSVGQINERIDLSQSALSQQLARLRADGLVATRREAQTIYYHLPPGPARELIAALHRIYCGASEGNSAARNRSRRRG